MCQAISDQHEDQRNNSCNFSSVEQQQVPGDARSTHIEVRDTISYPPTSRMEQGHAYLSAHMDETTKYNSASSVIGMIPTNHSQYSGGRSWNYEAKYAADPLGKEMSDNAQVFKVYLDEAESHDDDIMGGFKETIDSLLIFVQLLRAAGNSTAISAVPKSSVDLGNASVDTHDLWINGLFLASLSLALVTALLSVLVKQWLQAYSSISAGNAKQRFSTAHFPGLWSL
ncbi:hypothetical protein F5876DRAFT_70826 [Lentinula aff. lateritia]|uniref:Uncharacterized protein n=1 Tax=Lentinula aff. lateritia TaxID=2804960 RepID=A0ACC1THR8_9AGAR|nr:hypothetical protein F5876DRAFT_70826 [Lentinula aff. lateritia]